jgi:hypothetical protein
MSDASRLSPSLIQATATLADADRWFFQGAGKSAIASLHPP